LRRISDIYAEFKEKKNMIFNEDDKMVFEEAPACHICNKPFKDAVRKFRDQCHRMGKFRGAAHECCNLKYEKLQSFSL